MKYFSIKTIISVLISFISITYSQNQAPVVQNVIFHQRTDGTNKVDISYDVYDSEGDTMTVTMQVSSNNGSSWDFSCNNITGDLGSGITSGTNKNIVWDFATEHPNTFSDKFIIKIIADDDAFNTGIPCPGTPTVLYEDKIYYTVQIGTQCWLRNNLDIGIKVNYNQPSSNDSVIQKYCYYDDLANCTAYGGLYRWNEAIQYSVTHSQGICPSGWHIPTLNEFQTLSNEVGGDGNSLKREDQGYISGQGTNTTGFSALLAGYISTTNHFHNLTEQAYFWSSSEFDANDANILNLINDYYYIFLKHDSKENGYSVRCIKDEAVGSVPPAPILQSPTDGASNVSIPTMVSWYASTSATSYILQVSASYSFTTFIFNENVGNVLSNQVNGLNNSTQYYWRVYAINSFGPSDPSSIWSFTTSSGGGETSCPGIPTITDPRNGKVYHTVLIDTQLDTLCWLKENMDIGTMIPGSQTQTIGNGIEKYCYDNIEANCDTFGGLYQWDEAMQYSTLQLQGICPLGWHIPTLAEFDTLRAAVNYDGNSLKREDQGSGNGQGTNTSGFSAILAGFRYIDGTFGNLGNWAYFWSSTENSATSAYKLTLSWYGNGTVLYFIGKDNGYSVRCIKD